MKSVFAAAISLFMTVASAHAVTIVSTVGILPSDASCFDDGECRNGTPTGINGTLTGGWISSNRAWTHTYAPINGTITSATLSIDLLDADSGRLEIRQNTANGTIIATLDPTGVSSTGGPGPWHVPGFGVTGLVEFGNIAIASTFFSDLMDGSFTFFGRNVGMSIWGVNQSTLTITYEPSVVPLPASVLLLAAGLGGLGLMSRRRRKLA